MQVVQVILCKWEVLKEWISNKWKSMWILGRWQFLDEKLLSNLIDANGDLQVWKGVKWMTQLAQIEQDSNAKLQELETCQGDLREST